eukprot:EG_transcript_14362
MPFQVRSLPHDTSVSPFPDYAPHICTASETSSCLELLVGGIYIAAVICLAPAPDLRVFEDALPISLYSSSGMFYAWARFPEKCFKNQITSIDALSQSHLCIATLCVFRSL